MSTKTSIKRIALVAVAALAFGGVSAISAQANLVASGTASASSIEQVAGTGDGGAGGVAGPANSLQIVVFNGQTTAGVGNLKAFVTVSGGTISTASETSTSVASGGASAVVAQLTTGAVNTANRTGAETLTVLTPTAGSLVITVYDETAVGSGLYSSTASSTKTITINAASVAGTATVANSLAYDTVTASNNLAQPWEPAASLLSAPTVSATVGTYAVARYAIKGIDANGNKASSSTSWTVTMTGPGTIAGGNVANGAKSGARALSITGDSATVFLYGDGSSGTTTLTFQAGSTTIATKSVTFYSSTVKSLTATTVNKYVGIAATGWTAPAGGDTGDQAWVCIVAKDASGNAIPSNTGLTVTSSNTAVVTVGSLTYDTTDGCVYPALTGVAAGTATISVKDAATGLITASADVQVVSAVVSSIALSTDKSSYAPGDKVKVQLTATNAAGTPVADGTYLNLIEDTMTTSIPFGSGTLFDSNSTKPSFKSGVAYRTLYAPNFGGTINLTYYLGSTKTLLSAALIAIAGSATGTAQTASFSVTAAGSTGGDAALALDAANAATDAANNAYDEAQNATQAAQDALAAVTALAKQVSSLIASVKAVTALFAKIKAKLKA